ncbi:hypothetical protein ACM66B_002192 [Microbotryomycetes sp. NB124-2]
MVSLRASRALTACLLILVNMCQAATISVRLQSNTTRALEPTAFVQLSSNQLVERANVPLSGSIEFANVEQGDYLVSIKSNRLRFHTYAVTVDEQDQVRARLHVLGHGDVPGTYLGSTLHVQPLGPILYSSRKQGFNPIAIFKSNPMLLLLAVAAVSVVLLPKLLEMLDPELVQEVQQNQADMHSKLASLQNLEFSKLLSSQDSQAQGSSSAVSSSSGNDTPKSKKGKRR